MNRAFAEAAFRIASPLLRPSHHPFQVVSQRSIELRQQPIAGTLAVECHLDRIFVQIREPWILNRVAGLPKPDESPA
jgi:hypothetical protein